jgi:hypothetical protein
MVSQGPGYYIPPPMVPQGPGYPFPSGHYVPEIAPGVAAMHQSYAYPQGQHGASFGTMQFATLTSDDPRASATSLNTSYVNTKVVRHSKKPLIERLKQHLLMVEMFPETDNTKHANMPGIITRFWQEINPGIPNLTVDEISYVSKPHFLALQY